MLVSKSGYVLWWLSVLVTQVCVEFNVVGFFIAVKWMVPSLFVMSCMLCIVIFIIALCCHACVSDTRHIKCVICIFYCLFVICSNLSQSAPLFETFSICLCGLHTEEKNSAMSFNCSLSNGKISVSA